MTAATSVAVHPSATTAATAPFPRKKYSMVVTGSDATAATVANSDRDTSPLTLSSHEATAHANAASAGQGNVPRQVVSSSRTTTQQSSGQHHRNNPGLAPSSFSSSSQIVDETTNAMAMLGMTGTTFSSTSTLYDDGSARTSSTATNQRSHRTPPTEFDNCKLFVGGIPTDVTEEGFYAFFNQFGPVVDSVVMVDRLTKRSRGFGFVTFANASDALRLLTSIPGKTGHVIINCKQCEVKASTPKQGDSGYKHQGGGGGGGQQYARSNQSQSNYYNRQYNRTTSTGSSVAKQQIQQPREAGGGKDGVDSKQPPHVDNEYNANNMHQGQFLNAYQTGAYGRTPPTASYHYPHYLQNAYPTTTSGGYVVYPGSIVAGGSAIPPTTPYHPPQGHGTTGYYHNPYAYTSQYNPQPHGGGSHQQPYGNQSYANMHPSSMMHPQTMGWNAAASYNANYNNATLDGAASQQHESSLQGQGGYHGSAGTYRDDRDGEHDEESVPAEEYD